MNIFLDMVGCRLNQSELEAFAAQFRALGHQILNQPEEADLVVINTCSVTAAAASDSRSKIRQAARKGAAQIVVTGCWSTLQPEQAKQLPNVSYIIPNLEKEHLVQRINPSQAGKNPSNVTQIALMPGDRMRTRAFIKVQDGCNNRCTFCVTTLARGDSRSRKMEHILGDIARVANNCAGNKDLDTSDAGAKEIVLTGVHLGSWGQDFESKLNLSSLIETILKETDVPRIRLSSLEPWDIDDDFFALWENPRLCRQLHLPLQSGSQAILKRMGRKTTPEKYVRLIETARAYIPSLAITTDIMVGFPGENEVEFAESLDFVRRMEFAGGHVFSFSPRPGTAAAIFDGAVESGIKKERSLCMRKALETTAFHYRDQFINQVIPVLWESRKVLEKNIYRYRGLTDNYLRVQLDSHLSLWNSIASVKLVSIEGDIFRGEMVSADTAD